MKLLIIFLLMCSTLYAGEVLIDNQTIIYDDEYSMKDFTEKNLLDDVNINNKIIYGSCFSREIPDTRVFPDVENLTLVKCNLDNVRIDPRWTVIQCSQKRFIVQNDLRDWIIDENGNPIEVLNKEYWESIGYNVDPSSIPIYKLSSIEEIKRIEQ